MSLVGMAPLRARLAGYAPLLILVAALLLRIAFTIQMRGSPLADVPMRDEFTLVEWARDIAGGNLVGGDVYFRAPLYPYLLGLIFSLFRGSLFAARMAQALLGSLVPLALFYLGRRVFGTREGVIAGLVAAAYPVLAYFNNELLAVSLAVLLNVLLLLAALRADDRGGTGPWLTVGLLLGLSAITRPNVLLFAPFLLLWVVWRARSRPAGGRRVALGRVALVLCGAAVVILPVTVRNYAVGGDFVPIASQGGINFYIGNNPRSDGASAMLPALGTNWEYEDAIRIAEREEGRRLKPSEVSAFWYRRGREFLLSRPGTALRLYVRKLVLFWDSHEIGSNKDIYYFGGLSPVFRAFSWLGFLIIAPLGLLGASVGARRRPAAWLLTLFVVSYMVSVLAFFVNGRFRLPVVPPLIVLAAGGAAWLYDKLREGEWSRFAAGAAALLAIGLFVGHDFYGTHVTEHAHTHYTIGLAHASRGRLDEAVEEYRTAIGLWPGYASAHDALGETLERLGLWDEALESYRSAADLSEGNAEAPMHAGVVLLRMGDMEGGIEWLREATRRDPSMGEAHYYLASTLAGEGDLAAAERSFRAAVESRPDLVEAWNGLGRVLEDTGRSADALGAYETAVSIDPAFADAYNNVGVLLAEMGRYDESIARLEQGLEAAPGDRRLLSNLKRVRDLEYSAGGID